VVPSKKTSGPPRAQKGGGGWPKELNGPSIRGNKVNVPRKKGPGQTRRGVKTKRKWGKTKKQLPEKKPEGAVEGKKLRFKQASLNGPFGRGAHDLAKVWVGLRTGGSPFSWRNQLIQSKEEKSPSFMESRERGTKGTW